MKKFFIGVALGLSLGLFMSISFANGQNLAMEINALRLSLLGATVAEIGESYQNIYGEVPYSILYNGTAYLPIRLISGLFENSIFYDDDTKTVTLAGNNHTAHAIHSGFGYEKSDFNNFVCLITVRPDENGRNWQYSIYREGDALDRFYVLAEPEVKYEPIERPPTAHTMIVL